MMMKILIILSLLGLAFSKPVDYPTEFIFDCDSYQHNNDIVNF